MQAITMKARWRLEEILNAVTHGIGTALAVAALTAMLLLYYNDGVYHLTSCLIYGGSLILLYLASTLYHSFSNERVKAVFKFIDHAAIYVVIAGSYTPFCLISLRGPWGWWLFAIVWSLAVIGMLQEIKPRSDARIMSLVIYAVMGWVIVVAVRPLLDHLAIAGFVWLALGGALYTVGIVFYAFDSRFRHWHGIWHLFVIGGSLAHYLAIALYVV